VQLSRRGHGGVYGALDRVEVEVPLVSKREGGGFYSAMDQVEESEREKTRERCENWRKYLARGTRREPRAASVKRQFLTVVLIFRSYAKDPAKLTSRELRQWIQYMFYAGVDHIFVYHCYHPREEEGEEKTELKELLSPWIRGGYVSYYDWSKTWQRPFLDGQQVPAYQHCIDKFRIQMEWQVAVDIDEYPFSEQDLEPDFLRRQVSSVASSQPHVAEILNTGFALRLKIHNKDHVLGLLLKRISSNWLIPTSRRAVVGIKERPLQIHNTHNKHHI